MKKILYAFGLLLCASLAHAQAPVLTFTPSTETGAGSVATTLTWSTTPAAQSCTASGHSSWTGTKPVQSPAGGFALPSLTVTGTYTLTMSCTWPGDTTATVRWVAPTTNTDGSALAKCASGTSTGPCLVGYNVYRRVGSTDLSGGEMTPVRDPNALSRAFTGLGAGTHNFGVEAVNGDGVPSVMSNMATKVITVTASANRSITITVNPKPSTTAITVE